MTLLLKASSVSAGYGGMPVIRDCSLEAKTGQTIAIVGRNGAGKTTLVSAISGRIPLLDGEILYAGQSIGRLPAYQRSRAGIVHVPQGREMFARLTVHENLTIAAHAEAGAKEWELVYELFPVLKERINQTAGTLSGGEQQMVALGRAVMRRPSLMILDEPSLGLAPKVVEMVFDRIRLLQSTLNTTLILVEQQARWVWDAGIVDFVYVLLDGTIVASGTPEALPEDIVQDSYLGKVDAD
jgi:branched-chain amino acid transport system ATP-binding protein